ncbi:MAG: translocation/assembly module TamB domain-containing protein, partial [Pseudobdellovibrionaceae bacterium]
DDLKFKSENINNPLFSSSLEGELRVIYKETGYHFVPTVNADFEILSFKAFSGLLADNGLTVPAPLNVLEGKIHVGVHTTLEDSPTGMTVPMQITALLKSQLQKLDVLANVRATIQSSRKSAMVLVNIKVNDLVLELPPLDPIRGIPKIGEDSRMKTAGEAAKETSTPEGFKVGFVYDVKTVDPDGVRLLSRLAVPHIPLSVDFTRNLAGSTTGNLRIMPFELRYLHRRIEVDHMRVILDDRDTADYAVDGRLRVNNNPSYKIQIEISGTIRSPSVKLTSEPELSRPDIISVILYGRTNDQLVQADREIVGSFDAAVADRAIGLLGLWAFSSTPIQSFSYNPLTKVYAASVQVAEGTTASIGTDWEEAAQLEVRKHVTKRWVLTATYSPAQSAASQSGKLTLQWEKRF